MAYRMSLLHPLLPLYSWPTSLSVMAWRAVRLVVDDEWPSYTASVKAYYGTAASLAAVRMKYFLHMGIFGLLGAMLNWIITLGAGGSLVMACWAYCSR